MATVLSVFSFVLTVSAAIIPQNTAISIAPRTDTRLLSTSIPLNLSLPSNISLISVNPSSLLATLVDSPTTRGCFDPPPPASHIPSLVKGECYEAAENLLDVVFKDYWDPDKDVTLTFGRGVRNTDVQLPQSSVYGGCGIYIDVVGARGKDTVVLRSIFGAALDLVSRCTIGLDGGKRVYGGKRFVGPKSVIEIVVEPRRGLEGDSVA